MLWEIRMHFSWWTTLIYLFACLASKTYLAPYGYAALILTIHNEWMGNRCFSFHFFILDIWIEGDRRTFIQKHYKELLGIFEVFGTCYDAVSFVISLMFLTFFFPMDRCVVNTKFSFNFDGIPDSIYLLSNYVSDTVRATGI